MKRMKRLLSICLAVLMVAGIFGMYIPKAQAAPLIDETEKGSITIHKRKVTSLSDWLEETEVKPGNGLELDDDHYALEESEPLGGVDFLVIKMIVKTVEHDDHPYDIEVDGIEYTPELADPDAGTDYDDEDELDNPDNYVYYKVDKTDDDGIVVFDDLTVGFYEVIEQIPDTVYLGEKPFLVQIPFTDPSNGNNLLYDIHVYPKNQEFRNPRMDAWITEVGNLYDSYTVWGPSVNPNGYIPWIMEGEIPPDVGTANWYNFFVTDVKDTPLLFSDNYSSYSVYILDENGDKAVEFFSDGDPALGGADPDYKFTTYDKNGDPAGQLYNIDTIEFFFYTKGLQKMAAYMDTWIASGNLIDTDENGDEIMVYPKIYVESRSWYEWMLTNRVDNLELGEVTTKKISDYVATKIHPEFKLLYGNMAADEGDLGEFAKYWDTVQNPPYAYYGGFMVDKYDGETDVKLAGAKFKIYEEPEEPDEGEEPELLGTVITDITNFNDWEVTTIADGSAWFYGIKFGGFGIPLDDVRATTDYLIVETQSPFNATVGDYYNLLGEPKKITVNATSHLSANKVEVPNYMGLTLPNTGGIGTVLFIIIGIALIGTASVILYLNRRKSIQE